MIGRPEDNGRCGGGSAGKENRYHFPAVDDARFDEAHPGADSTAPLYGEAGYHEAAMVNTMAGGRGKCMGADYGRDKGQNGF